MRELIGCTSQTENSDDMKKLNSYALDWQNLSNSIRSFYTISVMIGSYGVLYLNSFGALNEIGWTLKMKLMFLSSIMIFFAAKIIIIFCPQEIRIVKNPSEFIRTNKEAYQNQTLRSKMLPSALSSVGTSITEHSDFSHFALGHYSHLSKKWPTLRFTATLLMLGGITILLLLDIASVFEIIRNAF